MAKGILKVENGEWRTSHLPVYLIIFLFSFPINQLSEAYEKQGKVVIANKTFNILKNSNIANALSISKIIGVKTFYTIFERVNKENT